MFVNSLVNLCVNCNCGRQFTARIGLVGHSRTHMESETGAHTSSRRGDSIKLQTL